MPKHARPTEYSDEELFDDLFPDDGTHKAPSSSRAGAAYPAGSGLQAQPAAGADAGSPAAGAPSDYEPSWQSYVETEVTRTKKRKRRTWRIVFIIAIVVLVGSLTALGVIAFSYFQGQQKYADIAETAGMDLDEGLENKTDEEKMKTLSVDWKALRKANPDVVAWLYIPNTVINYPVVQGQDNDYYLYHDFDGEAGWLAEYGAIFLDYANKPNWSDPQYFIYGHHMNDGSMFADIAGLTDQARFNAARTIYLLTPNGNFQLRSYSLVHCAADEGIVMTKFTNKKEMLDYIQDKINRSVVDVGAIPKASAITKSFAFATCDNYSEGRYVLYAYVVDTTVKDLAGKIGIAEDGGSATGFVEDLEVK